MSGDIEIKLARWEFSGLRIAFPPLMLDVGRIALQNLVAQLRAEGGPPRLVSLRAAEAELQDLKIDGPLGVPSSGGPAPQAEGPWLLDPLATADGTLQAEITDAHLLFDAQVAVPIGRGGIDFNRAAVEHVGPDSRMGVSRMGIYVDAPNGRSYLYQFPSVPVAGVAFERRGPLPGPWASDRGSLQLKPFVEALLRQGARGATSGVTEQARLLLGRTAVMGEVHLGDGRIAAPGMQGQLAGRTAGRNRLQLHSEAVGRGIGLDVPALSVREVVLAKAGTQLRCDEISGSLTLRLAVEGAQLRFVLGGTQLKLSGLQLSAG